MTDYPQQSQQQLLNAIRKCDAKTVEKLLKDGASDSDALVEASHCPQEYKMM